MAIKVMKSGEQWEIFRVGERGGPGGEAGPKGLSHAPEDHDDDDVRNGGINQGRDRRGDAAGRRSCPQATQG